MLLSFTETEKLLQKYGITATQSFFSSSIDKIMEKSSSVKKPWVLKVTGEEVLHKTEKKLIALDLYDFEHLYNAANRLKKNAAGLKNWGFVLQSQLQGTEFIIGGKHDRVFGKTVLFGSGGVAVELFKDFSTRVCPLSERDAQEMVSETKASVYFTREGFRGKKAEKKNVIELLLKTSRMLEKEPQIESLDFNPVIADEKNAWVVDAKITVEK